MAVSLFLPAATVTVAVWGFGVGVGGNNAPPTGPPTVPHQFLKLGTGHQIHRILQWLGVLRGYAVQPLSRIRWPRGTACVGAVGMSPDTPGQAVTGW